MGNLELYISWYAYVNITIYYLSVYLHHICQKITMGIYIEYIYIYIYIYTKMAHKIHTCVYMYIYIYIHTGSRFGSPSLPPPKMVWYPCRPPKIHHLHAICSISESRPPICFQFAAFQSHNLRLASYLQHLKAICYLHTTYVPFIGLSTVYVSFLPGIPIHKPSHSVSTYCSLVAYYWYITCAVYPYIYIYTTVLVA